MHNNQIKSLLEKMPCTRLVLKYTKSNQIIQKFAETSESPVLAKFFSNLSMI